MTVSFCKEDTIIVEKKKHNIEEVAGAILLGGMAVLTFFNVLNRYIFKRSLAFTEEITVSLFVWITLIGIAMAFRKGANLQMTNLFDRFSPKLQRAVRVAAAIIGILIFLFIIFNSAKEIYKNITFYQTTSEALGIPTWIYSLGTPVFSLMIIWELVQNIISATKKTNAKEGEK